MSSSALFNTTRYSKLKKMFDAFCEETLVPLNLTHFISPLWVFVTSYWPASACVPKSKSQDVESLLIGEVKRVFEVDANFHTQSIEDQIELISERLARTKIAKIFAYVSKTDNTQGEATITWDPSQCHLIQLMQTYYVRTFTPSDPFKGHDQIKQRIVGLFSGKQVWPAMPALPPEPEPTPEYLLKIAAILNKAGVEKEELRAVSLPELSAAAEDELAKRAGQPPSSSKH